MGADVHGSKIRGSNKVGRVYHRGASVVMGYGLVCFCVCVTVSVCCVRAGEVGWTWGVDKRGGGGHAK